MATPTRWEFNWAVRLVSLDPTTPTQKQRTGCRSSSVSSRQRHQRRSLQRPSTYLWIALTSQLFSHLWCPKPLGDVISSYAAVDGELHADDYTGAPSCRPIVHVEAMITNIDDSTLKFWRMKYWRIALKTTNPPK